MNPTANYQTQPSYELNPVASQPKASSMMSEYFPSGSGWTALYMGLCWLPDSAQAPSSKQAEQSVDGPLRLRGGCPGMYFSFDQDIADMIR